MRTIGSILLGLICLNALGQVGQIRVQKLREQTEYEKVMREQPVRRCILKPCCITKRSGNFHALIGAGLAYSGQVQVGAAMQLLRGKFLAGALLESELNRGPRLSPLLQYNLLRTHTGHGHRILSSGVKWGMPLRNETMHLEPYMGVSWPGTCFLNRFQGNIGYRIPVGQNTEATPDSTKWTLGMWMYL